jgi:hypothetical protein
MTYTLKSMSLLCLYTDLTYAPIDCCKLKSSVTLQAKGKREDLPGSIPVKIGTSPQGNCCGTP